MKRPGFLHGVSVVPRLRSFSGFEQEGFYDIVTGRPRMPYPLYNITRSGRVKAREDVFKGPRAGNIHTYFPRPQGSAHTIPNYQQVLLAADKQKRYSRMHWPAIL